jgi:putative transposase
VPGAESVFRTEVGLGVELGEDAGTGRPKRADEAGGICHALKRGHARATIFHKPEDCRYVNRNAWRAGMVRRAEDWRWGSLSRWLDESEREPRLLSAWPIARSPRWTERVNRPLTAAELKAVRNSVHRGLPIGDENWVQAIARHLNLQSTQKES